MDAQVNKFGFEIEGIWADETRYKLAEDWNMQYTEDGSIRDCNRSTCDNPDKHNLVWSQWEMVSRPERDLEHVKKIFEAIDEGGYCKARNTGFHVHVSFEPERPPEIFSEQFYLFFRKRLIDRFPDVWEERKENRYCRPLYRDNDMEKKPIEKVEKYDYIDKCSGSRYYDMNFSAFRRHKTIEVRIFPADEPMKMYEYLKFTIDTINEFLNQDKVGVEMTFETPDMKRVEIDVEVGPAKLTNEGERRNIKVSPKDIPVQWGAPCVEAHEGQTCVEAHGSDDVSFETYVVRAIDENSAILGTSDINF